MSDGNFNRTLLPKNELSAGIRAGKAQMRAKAEKAIKEIINQFFPNAPTETKEAATKEFIGKLR